MPDHQEPPITELLERYRHGDNAAAGELAPLVYDELHRRAERMLRSESRALTIQPTSLVHEAWLRLGHDRGAPWESRSHFLRLAGRVMRNVLVDHARRRNAEKRSPGHDDAQRLTVSSVEGVPGPDLLDVLALHEAMECLEHHDPQLVRIVELRHFAGLTLAETGDALGLSVRQVHRAWGLARAWLVRELRKGDVGSDPTS